MHKTQAKIDNMSTAEWQQYHQLLANRRVVEYFAAEVERFSRTALKPDEVLRRFSLNGDGQLDLREFQLALKRLGILSLPPAIDTPEQQQQAADAFMKAKELYSVFCPSQTKKLDIDMFCRIMTEWSIQLIRARHDLQRQQQQQQQFIATSADLGVRPSSSSGRPGGAKLSSFKRSDQFGSPGAVLSAPYATESSRNATCGPVYGVPQSLHGTQGGGGNSESEAIWRRISDAIVQNLDKLSQIFFKMDIACTGSVSREEFELAMSHIGVFLTAREYDKAYASLSPELKDFTSGSSSSAEDATSTFGIKYTDFLALFHGKSSLVLPTTSKHASPPVAGMGNARLWDFLVHSIDKLQPLFQQLERINQRYVSPDMFRDCLARCGLALSNADYAALRVRLLPFTDSSTGAIGLAPLMQALRASDHSAMRTSSVSSPIAMPAARAVDISPIRTGRRTNFQAVHDSYNPQLHASVLPSSTPHPAGKSNEQRNVEANRTIVKIRDESRWRSDSTLYGNPETPAASDAQDTSVSPSPYDDPMFGSRSHVPLEKRILVKLQQMKELGQLGSSSPQTIFPGDRFGRITRGQFRQSLVHLSVLARYAEVETIFWTLDPTGRGFIANHELYDHFNAFVARERAGDAVSAATASSPRYEYAGPGSAASAPWSTLPAINTDGSSSPSHARTNRRAPSASNDSRLPRSAQKVLEGMLTELPHLLAICQRNDAAQTGMVSPQELLTAIQELGILASIADLQSAIFAVFSGMEELNGNGNAPPTIPYKRLEARLSQLCSDLLSPKKRKMHLSTTSVLLAPQEQSYDELIGGKNAVDMHTVSETDALWNCPRRRMNQDHRATKTSVRISDHVSDDVGLVQTRLTQSAPKSSQQQQREEAESSRKLRVNRLAVIGILHDLLERRVELKTAVDMHRHADVHGQVSREDLAEILLTSRLGLHFSSSSSGVSAREFVETLYPAHTPRVSITYLDLLHRAGEVLAELKRTTPATALGGHQAGGGFKQQQQRQTARRLNSTVEIGLPSASPSTRSLESSFAMCGLGDLSSDEASVRRKLLGESRLKDLLVSDSGRQSAAILVRHAFKGLAPREMVVPIENGEYEATCRSSDVKHVCFRLGLDLDLSEQQFVALSIDKSGSGFVSSPQLLDFFTQLALSSPSLSSPEAASYLPPRVTKGGQFRGFEGTQPTPPTASMDPQERSRYNSGLGGQQQHVNAS